MFDSHNTASSKIPGCVIQDTRLTCRASSDFFSEIQDKKGGRSRPALRITKPVRARLLLPTRHCTPPLRSDRQISQPVIRAAWVMQLPQPASFRRTRGFHAGALRRAHVDVELAGAFDRHRAAAAQCLIQIQSCHRIGGALRPNSIDNRHSLGRFFVARIDFAVTKDRRVWIILSDECLLVCCPKSNAAIIYQSELIYTDEVTPSWHELHLVAGHRDIHPLEAGNRGF